MDCVNCFRQEYIKGTDGSYKQVKVGKNVTAICCSKCVQILLFTKAPKIPWDGKQIEKVNEDENGRPTLRRRKK